MGDEVPSCFSETADLDVSRPAGLNTRRYFGIDLDPYVDHALSIMRTQVKNGKGDVVSRSPSGQRQRKGGPMPSVSTKRVLISTHFGLLRATPRRLLASPEVDMSMPQTLERRILLFIVSVRRSLCCAIKEVAEAALALDPIYRFESRWSRQPPESQSSSLVLVWHLYFSHNLSGKRPYRSLSSSGTHQSRSAPRGIDFDFQHKASTQLNRHSLPITSSGFGMYVARRVAGGLLC